MANRAPKRQSRHDQVVKRETQKLERDGWKVKADIPGFDQPTPIGQKRRIPDIEAAKSGRVRLIEVETPESLDTDREQQSTFRRSAAQRPNTTFKVVETG